VTLTIGGIRVTGDAATSGFVAKLNAQAPTGKQVPGKASTLLLRFAQ
jgi:hypothetical protein